MPKLVFKYLWDNLKAGNDVHAFVKNRTKDNGFYWVMAHVRVAKNPDGSFRNYVSTRKEMSLKAREAIEPLYAEMLAAENEGGMAASLKVLERFLAEHGATLVQYNEMMKKLNN